ncbi:hypothetical protein HBI56_022630 [Parastagonospora nodorum]|nr:hypothetical protein HBH53_083820 [Parastagonospora nodorum]KAH3975823.1 hypothetical protein HBH51_081530 [Parastagonospora nodorum]KAH4005824.1 hypothetical protein HBI10_027130 [Parastagonospora nodorum]KAH4023124.1 hypothetical protein HBI13_094740 [Parastagonospora nodorum]KAH4054999.1 hypothetical protein HBH49_070060 [Parastagonospora nodorum]
MAQNTRSKRKGDRNETPPAEAANPPMKLVNPLRKENWPREPKSDEEFLEWMEATKKSLKTWLRESQALAQDTSTKELVKDFNRGVKREWEQHKVYTDIQTGEIYDEEKRKEMETGMQSQKEVRVNLHATHYTWRKFVEYRIAQAAWEDFLYYQSVWNRKNKGKGFKQKLETVAERRAMTHKEKEKKNPIRGTKNADLVNRFEFDSSGQYSSDHLNWVLQLIKVFKGFHMGYRKRMPTAVGPEDAHRYTRPTRGTSPYAKRLRHLEERFPRKKRKVIDPIEVEEDYRSRSERQKDNELERKDGMTPIEWAIDQTRFEEEKRTKEGRESADSESDSREVDGEYAGKKTATKYALDRRTLKLRPKDHLLHHGNAESSFDWPTSFESPDWGNAISRTGRKGAQSYGLITYSDEDEDSDVQSIKKVRLPQYRKKGDPELTKPHKIRYKKQTVNKPGRIFVYDRNPDGTVVGRVRDEQWSGHWTDGEVETEEFVMDEAGKRIPDDQDIGHNVFQTTTATSEKPRTTRRTRHQNENVAGQLSGDEDEEQLRDPNFKLSGTANPDQVGQRMDDWESSDTGGDDDKSDDDGDLFKQSYEECSCPHRRRARLLHARMLAEIGVLPPWKEAKTLDMVKNGSYEDKDIFKAYQELMEMLGNSN